MAEEVKSFNVFNLVVIALLRQSSWNISKFDLLYGPNMAI